MQAQPAPRSRIDVAAILVLISIGLWIITFALFRGPFYLFHAEGQLYALFPLALVAEATIVVLALVAAVLAIINVIRRRIGVLQVVLVLLGSVLMLSIGPVLLWFGTIPIGANLLG